MGILPNRSRGGSSDLFQRTMNSPDAFLEGQTLLIDKPLHWTSFQAVNKLKWLLKSELGLKKIKIGHAGTLDPLATGLLIVCTGKSTKTISDIQAQTKEYTGTIILGATTPSFDMETQIDAHFPIAHLTENMLREAAAAMTGPLMQKPPIYSAIKKEGKRLYEHARAGEVVEIQSRPVHIDVFELTRIELPEVDFRIVCSKGTYIRSMAADFGQAVQSGAYLSALRRTKIGAYCVDEALTPTQFEALLKS